MSLNRMPVLIVLVLLACGGPAASPPGLPQTQAPARSAARQSLDRLMAECLAVANRGSTPGAVEAQVRSAHARWVTREQGSAQFHAQAQALPDGRIQLQLQAQCVEGDHGVQAQRQVVLDRRP